MDDQTTIFHARIPVNILDRIYQISQKKKITPQDVFIWLLKLGLYQAAQGLSEAAKQSPDSKNAGV